MLSVKQILLGVIIFSLSVVLAAPAAYASVTDGVQGKEAAVVVIFVEGPSGNRISTGSGFVVRADGLIVTQQDVVLRWLESGDNSLFVKTHDSGYYPLKSIVSIDRTNRIALVRIDANGLMALKPALGGTPERAKDIIVIGSPDGLETLALEGKVSDTGNAGAASISVAMTSALRGSPVLSPRGDVMGLADVSDGKGILVPAAQIESLLEAADGEPEKRPAAEIDQLERSIAKAKDKSNSAEAHYALGLAYKRDGRNEEAIKAFRDAIRLRPDYAEAYNALGAALAGAGLHGEAEDSLREAIRLKHDFTEALTNLGFLYDFMGRHSEAVEAFYEALRSSPGYAEAYNGLGVSYARAGKYAEAVEAFRKALRLRPESKRAHFNLGLSYLMLGDEEAALRQQYVLDGLDPTLAGQLLDIIDARIRDSASSPSEEPREDASEEPR